MIKAILLAATVYAGYNVVKKKKRKKKLKMLPPAKPMENFTFDQEGIK